MRGRARKRWVHARQRNRRQTDTSRPSRSSRSNKTSITRRSRGTGGTCGAGQSLIAGRPLRASSSTGWACRTSCAARCGRTSRSRRALGCSTCRPSETCLACRTGRALITERASRTGGRATRIWPCGAGHASRDRTGGTRRTSIRACRAYWTSLSAGGTRI